MDEPVNEPVSNQTETPQKAVKKKSKKKIIIIIAIIIVLILSWAGLTKAGYIDNYLDIEILEYEDEYYEPSCTDWRSCPAKPIIYLYPEETQEVQVSLDYNGKIIADYPEYDYAINGWEVTAYPDGHLINHADNEEYSYLFWEGISSNRIKWDLSKGFVVKGEDTREFLQEILSEIGLTAKEYNEIIVYWYPRMMDNKYNLIHFAGEQYTENAKLEITPEPESILRVFMVFKGLDRKTRITPQEFKTFEREGFTVVEWGGTEL